MQRSEARTWLRSLSHTDRMHVAYDSQDPILHEAIAFAPAALSGVGEDVKAHVVDALTKARHGERVAELDASIAAFETAGDAYRLVEADLQRESGLSPFEVAQATAAE